MDKEEKKLNNLDEDFKELEMNFSEENDLNDNSNLQVNNSLKAYFLEIGKYKLLTSEEEYNLGKCLHNNRNCKLLQFSNVDSYVSSSLNKNLFFSSLINCKDYKYIVDILISYYIKNNIYNDGTLDILKKYKKFVSKSNRNLNSNELESFFGIKYIEDNLNEKELLEEVNKFILYKNAFNKMFLSNMRLVVSLAKKFQKKMDFMDLINEGNLGLIKAIDKFDYSLGNKFSTYATFWIKQSLKRLLVSQCNPIKFPEKYICEAFKIRTKIENLEKYYGKKLSLNEISILLDIPLNDIEKYLTCINDAVSLDAPITSDSSTYFIDFMADDYNLDDEIFQTSVKNDILLLFENLTSREREIIKLRFGLHDDYGNCLSLEEIGKIYNISRERVRQIENDALTKMKKVSRYNKNARELKNYIK